MKGVDLPSWIWVMGGVVIASILIIFGLNMMLRFQESNQKIFSIEAYNNLVDRANLVCSQSTGNIDYYRISLPDVVRAIYPANFVNEVPPDKVAQSITNLDSAKGRYVCMQFFGETAARCNSVLNCNTTMTYIGTPVQKNDLAALIAKLQGSYTKHDYMLVINKTDTRHVDINAAKELIFPR